MATPLNEGDIPMPDPEAVEIQTQALPMEIIPCPRCEEQGFVKMMTGWDPCYTAKFRFVRSCPQCKYTEGWKRTGQNRLTQVKGQLKPYPPPELERRQHV